MHLFSYVHRAYGIWGWDNGLDTTPVYIVNSSQGYNRHPKKGVWFSSSAFSSELLMHEWAQASIRIWYNGVIGIRSSIKIFYGICIRKLLSDRYRYRSGTASPG
jgi:hypothetical protein